FDIDPYEAPLGLEISSGFDPGDASALDGSSGLVLPGGGDIDPAWYGQKPHPSTGGINHQRDTFELTLVKEALARDVPVLAICHGMQLLNICLGGTLEQHLADDEDRFDHDRDRVRGDVAHSVDLKAGSVLWNVYGGSPIEVNSHHHQGLGRIAGALDEIGWAEDGVLEAVVSRDHEWVVGVQWHPEAMAPIDHRQLKLFEAFSEAVAARGRAAARRSA
ncbi:MAG: gamma-glutamyl-gamma-aminobutyrate hydrolase family protein, partial [Actinomycetota bacterium]